MPPENSHPEFRQASVADAELLLDLMRDYYAFDGHHYERPAAREALLGLLRDPRSGLAWLVFDAGMAVGYIVLCFGYSLEFLGRDAFLDEFYLMPSHRGRGWGRQTFEFVIAQARQQGIRAMHLEVVQKNAAAYEFYRKVGFRDREHRLMTRRL